MSATIPGTLPYGGGAFRFKDTQGRTIWCGPYALAVVCGTSYENALEYLRVRNNDKPVKTVYTNPLRGALYDYWGSRNVTALWAFTRDMSNPPKTLGGSYDRIRDVARAYANKVRYVIVLVTRHYVVLDLLTGAICDNQSQRWVSIEASRHRRKRIRAVMPVSINSEIVS